LAAPELRAEEAASIGDGLFKNPYVVAWPRGEGLAVKSVTSLEILNCTWPVAEVLLGADGDDELLRAKLLSTGVEDPDAIVADAKELGILLLSDQLEELERFYAPWVWGPVAAALMFGYQASSFADPETELNTRREREATDTSLLPDLDGSITALPGPPDGVLAGLRERRRSRRTFGGQPLTLVQLGECLRAGFGITGERIADNGRRLPLTAAPSSGALNTYDACVLSRNVQGLEAGTYRYLPQEHGLAREEGRLVPFDRLFGGQAWAAEAACAIVLVADLRRQASKYSYPTTVAAALIEAGARAELLLLEAEEASLSAVVVGMAGVGAFDQRLATAAGLWGPTSMTVPVCAVLLGAPEDS
jgi:SagB-type dehydrogenase family enzyme